jgi:hypothetical protein
MPFYAPRLMISGLWRVCLASSCVHALTIAPVCVPTLTVLFSRLFVCTTQLVRRGAPAQRDRGVLVRPLHEPARRTLWRHPPHGQAQGAPVERAARHSRGLARRAAGADLHLRYQVSNSVEMTAVFSARLWGNCLSCHLLAKQLPQSPVYVVFMVGPVFLLHVLFSIAVP